MKKLIITGIALLLAAGLCGCDFISELKAQNSQSRAYTERVQRDKLKKTYKGKGYACLKTSDEQDAYAAIDIAARSLESESFDIKNGSAFDNFGYILEFYKNDNPYVFWIKDDAPYNYVDKDDKVTIELEFKASGDELAEQKKKLDNAIKKAVDGAPKDPGTSTYAMELYINDYIVDNCEFDEDAAELHKKKKIRGHEQDVYGALVEGKAVCEGYARAFSLLCRRLGVECSLIEGYASEKNENTGKIEREAHIWNCVQLAGNWYHTDVTWNDDTSGEFADVYSRRYYYLNLTTKEITRDHEISPLYGEELNGGDFYNEFIPECKSTDYNYFRLNCPVLSDFNNPEDVVSGLAAAASKGEKYFDFLLNTNMDFSETKSKIAGSEGYEWIKEANGRNKNSPKLGDKCSLFAFEERRLVTFLLKYS